jgi:hypothetical protein
MYMEITRQDHIDIVTEWYVGFVFHNLKHWIYAQGALTHGDRRATETRDLSRFNIDNKYGRAALEATMKTIMGYEAPLVPPPQDYKGDFFKG